MDRKFGNALLSPLADLNLFREEIPPPLASAQSSPYGLPQDTSCEALGREIRLLDGVLDPDVDVPAGADPTLLERGSGAAADAVIGAVRSATEGLIPFRGWVRKITGADRYAREVSGAIAAGTIRRAFLKGIGQAHGCTPPAAPLRASAKEVLLPPPASDSNKAELVLLNESGGTLLASSQVVSDNGSRLPPLARKAYARIALAPGQHVLRSESAFGSAQLVLDVVPGKRYFVVIADRPDRSLAASLGGAELLLKQVDADQAAVALRDMQPQAQAQ